MKVDIYKSDTNKSKHVAVPAGSPMPGHIQNISDPDFQSVSLSQGNIDLQPGMIGINDVKAAAYITAHGHHIFSASVKVG